MAQTYSSYIRLWFNIDLVADKEGFYSTSRCSDERQEKSSQNILGEFVLAQNPGPLTLFIQYESNYPLLGGSALHSCDSLREEWLVITLHYQREDQMDSIAYHYIIPWHRQFHGGKRRFLLPIFPLQDLTSPRASEAYDQCYAVERDNLCRRSYEEQNMDTCDETPTISPCSGTSDNGCKNQCLQYGSDPGMCCSCTKGPCFPTLSNKLPNALQIRLLTSQDLSYILNSGVEEYSMRNTAMKEEQDLSLQIHTKTLYSGNTNHSVLAPQEGSQQLDLVAEICRNYGTGILNSDRDLDLDLKTITDLVISKTAEGNM